MSGQTKWIIGIASLFALLAIIAPVAYYIHDFHKLDRSSVPSDWGPFGDFFGGILNPIISLLSLIVTIVIAVNISRIEKRNHDESVHSPVKPLFTIESADFFSSDRTVNGFTVEKDFYDYTRPQQPAGSHDYLTKRFYLKSYNKGLGIATQINVSFAVDLNELKKLLQIDHVKIKVTSGEIKSDEDGRRFIVISVKSGPQDFNYQGSFKIWERERIGLGVVDKGEEKDANIPSQMMSAFQLHNLIRKLKNVDETFPTLNVTFNYKNIHEKSLDSKFRVALIHIHDYHDYSVYRIIHEQI